MGCREGVGGRENALHPGADKALSFLNIDMKPSLRVVGFVAWWVRSPMASLLGKQGALQNCIIAKKMFQEEEKECNL